MKSISSIVFVLALFLLPAQLIAQQPAPTISVEKGNGKLFGKPFLNFYLHNEGGGFSGCDIRVRAALKETKLLKDPFNSSLDILLEIAESGDFFSDEPDTYFGLINGKKLPKVKAFFMLIIQCEDELYTSDPFTITLKGNKKLPKLKQKIQKRRFKRAVKRWREDNIERFGDLV